jgi:hypothetical protein
MIRNATVPHTSQNHLSSLFTPTPFRFMPKYPVKNESGRKMIVTMVKMRMALF